ncbi:hypothetical protein PVAP13_6KG014300 [Panicum virgatum]|uniref:Uncharacterized protein n=1 Tax=Panicum virgatum TaxID=38727 RepID=A0A8T0R7B9_PANVG|nr:hypothetical protein PVAP13_6KG014300 [Panicum virgatum]KAG2581109.1 hypothetical protein PVAP13_6KG014300 [Panicum virgatum]KAG2581110.1 hypothetical protein PVAP13_6KG014300 [Panicum virgatum]
MFQEDIETTPRQGQDVWYLLLSTKTSKIVLHGVLCYLFNGSWLWYPTTINIGPVLDNSPPQKYF